MCVCVCFGNKQHTWLHIGRLAHLTTSVSAALPSPEDRVMGRRDGEGDEDVDPPACRALEGPTKALLPS